MKFCNTILLASLLLLDPSVLISGKKFGGGGSRPRPTGGSVPRPTSPTLNRPTSPANRPTANRPTSRPPFNNFRPTSTVKSPSNPSPTLKPVTPNGAPTIPSGGGGYNYQGSRAPTFGGGGSLIAAGLGGFIVGSFLYGGLYRNPSCGGGYGYGYYNGCNYGRTTQRHQCKAQIPLCRIPETIRSQWYTGAKTTVEIVQDQSICPIANDFSSNNTAPLATNLTLEECMNRVVSSGTCNARKIFIFDNVESTCGCCAETSRFTQTEFFSSTVYKFEENNDFERFGPPTQCISGSTMFWPKKTPGLPVTDATISGGGAFVDERYQCECGSCQTCGSPKVSYLDWAGPFSVPDGVAQLAATDSDTAYDPVDTCTCDEGSPNCPAVNGPVSAGNILSSSIFTSSLVLISSFVMFVQF